MTIISLSQKTDQVGQRHRRKAKRRIGQHKNQIQSLLILTDQNKPSDQTEKKRPPLREESSGQRRTAPRTEAVQLRPRIPLKDGGIRNQQQAVAHHEEEIVEPADKKDKAHCTVIQGHLVAQLPLELGVF